MNKRPVLVFSLGYLPTVGGSYHVLHELITRSKDVQHIVVTSKSHKFNDFDNVQSYRIIRKNVFSLINLDEGIITEKVSAFKIYKLLHFKVLKYFFLHLVFPLLAFIYTVYLIVKFRPRKILFAQSVLPFSWFLIILGYLRIGDLYTFVYGEEIVSYRHSNKSIGKLRFRLYIKGLNKCKRIITNSSVTSKEVLKEKINSNKIAIVYPAIDTNFFKPIDKYLAKAKFNVADNFVILSIGRLVRRKGFDTIIKILPKLNENIPNIKYIIKGQGYDKDYLVELVHEYGVSNNVIFLQDVPYKELPWIYSCADIFVLPNRIDELYNEQEGFGIVFLEANSCGIPVIGGNSGGVVDVIDDDVNGFLVDSLSKPLIESKVLDIYNGESKFKPERIIDHIENKFSWKKSIMQYYEAIGLI